MSFEALLRQCPLIAILRGIRPGEVQAVCDALYESGILLLEIPLNSPSALRSIGIAARHVKSRQLAGAGTVLTPEEAAAVRDAGGEFIISPNTDPEVIRASKRLGMISIPGFLTPSEAFCAIRAGADYLKLFPAGSFGPGYVKDLKAVVKHPILAVGGINRENLRSYLDVCTGAGIGSALYKPGKSLEEIARDAAAMVAGLKI